MDRALVLGDTGKLGRALKEAFSSAFEVQGHNRETGLDLDDFAGVARKLREVRPNLVANAVVFSGLDACEKDPDRAFRINALFPRHLARLSGELGFRLIHFSSDAVFDDTKGDAGRVESDAPCPMNVYGLTKFGGDCFVRAEAEAYHIHRLSVLFGPPGKAPQFLERMLARASAGERLRVSTDVMCSPSYSADVAARVLEVILKGRSSGLFHTANAGRASLFEVMAEVKANLGLEVVLEEVSHRQVGSTVPRAFRVSLESDAWGPLRSWRDALKSWCGSMGGGSGHPQKPVGSGIPAQESKLQ